MKTNKVNPKSCIGISILIVILIFNLKVAAQPWPYLLSPSGNSDKYSTFYPKIYTINSTNYITGFLSLSAYRNNAGSGTYYDDGIPVQKLQIQGGNILLSRITSSTLDLNPTSHNGAILFGDELNVSNTSGKWGIEYDDQYSTGGLNIFKPVSGLTTTRINHNFFLRNDGNVGIGTGSPSAKLQIADGDIFIQDIERGIIMKSPDGRCWRGTMNNLGQLQFVELPDCMVITEKVAAETMSSPRVYPNPTTNVLSIDLLKSENKKVILNVYNQTGQLIIEKMVFAQKNYDLDVSSLSTGTYTLKIIYVNFNEAIQFVKQ